MSPAIPKVVPQRQDVATTYSAEVERIRRLELRPGTGSDTAWLKLFNGTNSASWIRYRLHNGLIFLHDQLNGPTPLYSDPAWRYFGTFPVEHRPLIEYSVWLLWKPQNNATNIATPQGTMYRSRVLTNGDLLIPASLRSGTNTVYLTFDGQPPAYWLTSSYFPFG